MLPFKLHKVVCDTLIFNCLQLENFLGLKNFAKEKSLTSYF